MSWKTRAVLSVKRLPKVHSVSIHFAFSVPVSFIIVDVHRTLPNVAMFQTPQGRAGDTHFSICCFYHCNSKLILFYFCATVLERVLAAYCLRNPESVGTLYN